MTTKNEFIIYYRPFVALTDNQLQEAGIWVTENGIYCEKVIARTWDDAKERAEAKGEFQHANYCRKVGDLEYYH